MSAHPQEKYWQLAEAKNRFSELARSVLTEGPQKIYRRDGNLIVISEMEYLKLKGKSKSDFKDFLLHVTPELSELDLTRDKTAGRDINL